VIAGAPIVVDGVSKRYETPSGPVAAVDRVSLTVRPGEFISLLGPSGCGKSTVLGMVGGLVRPDTGRILIDAEPISGPNPKKCRRLRGCTGSSEVARAYGHLERNIDARIGKHPVTIGPGA